MKWNLQYLCSNNEEFKKNLLESQKIIEELSTFKSKLDDESIFCNYFKLQLKLYDVFLKSYQYASLKSDLNKKDVQSLNDLSNVQMLYMKLSEAISFANPEILKIGKEKVMSFVDRNKELEEFRFDFEKLFRKNEHVLDDKNEQLLSYFNPVSSQGGQLYSSLAVGDSVKHLVKLSNKEKVDINQSNYRGLIADSINPSDRKKIFETIFADFEKNKNTYAQIYNTVLLADKAQAKSRNYDTILESYLFDNNIPTSVYFNLVDVASNNNGSLKKYIKIRKEYLGLKQYYTYDRFLELADVNVKYSFEEAKSLFFKSIAKFPQDFQDKAHEVLADGFVDVMPQDGKRTGAYSSSMPNRHPFILLNYNNTLDDVFTVAHEAGHSIHSMYSNENQPTSLQDYTIFVAEIASTFNEHVLLDLFLEDKNISKDVKISLLQKQIDNIMSTFYRQTLFAEYELETHKLIENDQPINYEVLSQIMIRLYKKYYGLDIKKEKVKEYVWAYIPHLFYTPFYVYQYATSFSASFKIYKDVKEGVNGAFDRYIGLLKSGGSKYPVDQAKEAGVDFTTKEPFMAVVEKMDELVNELEKLLKE